MARLIDAYALMNKVRESKFKNPHEDGAIARNHMYEHDHFTKLICCEPTVDAVPVVHGRWIVKEHSAPYGGYHLFHCSKCDEPNARERNYCPNCGAKMDLEVKDA